MNIKITQIHTRLILAAVIVLGGVSGLVFSSTVAAQDNRSDPVLSYCMSAVPKARASCEKATQEARNKASYACEKSSKMATCIETKAKSYIKKASTGKPNDEKFKNQLDAIFDKLPGNRNRPSDASTKALAAEIVHPKSSGFGSGQGTHPCGNSPDGSDIVYTKFDLGCLGPDADKPISPIMDMLFSFIRFMSIGVGLVLVASIIWAGIQYSSSEGSAESTQSAKNRIRDAIVGLIVYIFAYSIVQFLVPGGIFN